MADTEAVDFEPEVDEMLEDDDTMSASRYTTKKGRTKGRGGGGAAMDDDRYSGKSGVFDSLDTDGGEGPQKCK